MLHMIGNAHIDPAWLWRWQQGYAEIKATFRSALDRMDEFPDFKFTCAGAAYYKWVEENCPEMFEEIRQRIAEGRWIIVGGWWIQPDCNIPCGESFVRQGLYSQRYFNEKFGKYAKVGYNVDSFGHNGMLPQILKKSKMDYYVFMRPDSNEKELESDLFIWEGVDGSEVKSFRISFSYGHWFEYNQDIIKEKNEKIQELANMQGYDFMSFYGVGNHGGGPTVKNVKSIIELKANNEDIDFSSPEQYFQEIEKKAYNLTVYKGDLQHHASGCYSAHSKIKRLNRLAENRAMTAEKIMSISSEIAGYKYDVLSMDNIWENIMFNQFHDIICGCSIKEVYEDSEYSFGESLSLSSKLINSAFQKITWSIDTSKGMRPVILDKSKDSFVWETDSLGVPVVVFNPLSFTTKYPIQLNRPFGFIEDNINKPVSMQLVRASRTNRDDKCDTLFLADVPAFGYRVFWAFLNKTNESDKEINGLKIGQWYMENNWLKVEFEEKTGFISCIYDKEKNVATVKRVGAYMFDETRMDTWGHGEFIFDNKIGLFDNAKFSIIESGPIRCAIRVESYYNNSAIKQDYILYSHKRNIEVKAKIDFREQHKMVKIEVETLVSDTDVYYEIPYGYIKKTTNGLEEPAQMWGLIEGKIQSTDAEMYGVALLNNSKYSYSAENNRISMIIARGSIYADHFGERDDLCEFMDQGIQDFSYSILCRSNMRKEEITKEALVLNTEPLSVIETYHEGDIAGILTGIEIDCNNVIATTLKKSQSNNAYILRAYEAAGFNCSANISLPHLNRQFECCFSPHEIKTIRIPLVNTESITEVDMIEF